MRSLRTIAMAVALTLISAGAARSQNTDSAAAPTAAPTAAPKLALLAYQRFPLDKLAEGTKALEAAARACASLDVPNAWIGLQSVTGEPEVLTLDPFNSFAQIDRAYAAWGPIYAGHPELAKAQSQIQASLSSERTVIAERRDDLSYRLDRIDLSKAHFIRILEVQLFPGHEEAFAQALEKLSAAHGKANSDLPWVVYEVNAGMPTPAFYVIVPMKSLAQNDDLLGLRERLLPQLSQGEGVEGEGAPPPPGQIYANMESNLYAVSPASSHVSKEFAAGDPAFWTPKSEAHAKSQSKP